MEVQRVSVLLLAALIFSAEPAPQASQRPSSTQAREQQGTEATVAGRIATIHSSRLFVVRETDTDREVPVLAPRPLQAVVAGAQVTAGGVLSQFSEAELMRASGVVTLDERTRKSFVGRLVLVAQAVIVTGERQRVAIDPTEAPPLAAPAPPRLVGAREQRERSAEPKPLTVRAAMLAANVDEFAGRPLRVLHGRVVGVLQPTAFLIEPATSYLKAMGLRDRLLVLIDSASLRVPADLIVGSTVTVTGVARTLVGIQVTREVAWPTQLQPETVERLEIRGALLATSVQTPEGTELTDRPSSAAR